MDLATFRAVFLLLAWLRVSIADVAPPTNVTLHCRNLKNVLKWSYEDPPPPGLRFRVKISSLNAVSDERWVDPPAQHQDVSFLNDPENDYLIDITAVIGQSESAYAPPDGISFSYFESSLANQKCHLDFPSVKVTARPHGSVLFCFTHPWLLYFQKPPRGPGEEIRKKRSANLPQFKYHVQIGNQTEHTFFCQESVCEKELPVDAEQEKLCLKMEGALQSISVQATQAYCALRPETPSYVLPLCIGGGLLAVLSLGFVAVMLYHKGTMANNPAPNFLTFPKKLQKATHTMPKETFNVPEVEPGSPTLLLQAQEEGLTPLGPHFTEPEFRLPIGVSAHDEGTDRESEYMAGEGLDEDEYSDNVQDGYEKRPVLDNLSPGELTEGYRG
ncbi:growth/differentiation factor 10b [Spinachia spinachia]